MGLIIPNQKWEPNLDTLQQTLLEAAAVICFSSPALSKPRYCVPFIFIY